MKPKKIITFIYQDAAEKELFIPIAKEAKKRGYKVEFSTNQFKKCEIGFYCQHINFPQYSKFSVIMLHDLIQQYSNWPDLWFREPWNKYDIGFLPSKQWINNWNKCSQYYYANPKKGIYEAGWPKSDEIKNKNLSTKRTQFNKENNLDNSKATVLYAPAWENNNKQDDFVKSIQKLKLNMIIKQGPWSSEKWRESRPEIYNNILEMKKMHQGIKNLTILDDKLNILEAISVSDILVSEESSTMCEAVMMGIPAISVSDWLIPDCTPPRFPKNDYDFVIKTTKKELTNCVSEMLENYSKYKKEADKFSKNNFSTIDNTSSIIMEIINDYVEKGKTNKKPLKPNTKTKRIYIKKYLKHISICIKNEIAFNYSRKSKTIDFACFIYRKIKSTKKKH